MKIRYDSNNKVFVIKIDPLETTTIVHTTNLVEARQMFIEHMTGIFDNTVRDKFKSECDENKGGVVIHV